MAWFCSGRWGSLLLVVLMFRGTEGFQAVHSTPTYTRARPRILSLLRSSVSEAQEAEIVAWSQTVVPEGNTQLVITDIQDEIPLAAMFWNVVADLKGSALFAFPLASFSLSAFAEMVQGLDFGIQLTALEDGPCPAMLCEYHTTGVHTDPTLEPSAMKRWVQDVIVDSRVCPYTKTADLAGVGVAGVNPGAIGYPVCKVVGSDCAAMCAVIASFWNNCLDLLNTPSDDLSTILLCAPGIAPDSHEQFVRVSDAIVKTMQLAGANRYVSLVFFHPLYDRNLVEPKDLLTHGHLPPHSWLSSYLKLHRTEDEVNALTDEDLLKANYQRRSPYYVINVLRAYQVAKAENVVPWEIIEPEPGRQMRVSGARIYAQNTWRFATNSESKTDPVSGYEYRVSLPSSRD